MNEEIVSHIIRKFLAISAVSLLAGTGAAKACQPNLSPSQESQAERFLAENRPAMAYGFLHSASQQGSGGAYRSMARMYESGRGVEKNALMARHMYWMGSQYNDSESLFQTAKDFFDRGHRKDGDYFAQKAIDCGHPGAIILLLEKRIAEGKEDVARGLLELAIDKGIPEAKYILAEQFDKGSLGLPKDHQRAFYWYTEAAKHGEGRAMAAIAYYFVRGLHGVQDDVAAIEWYHRAAKAGHVDSMTAYAWMLMQGKGAQMNKTEAKHYFKKAAALGSSQAVRFLSELS